MSKEFKIGAIILGAIVVLVVGINFLKGHDVFGKEKHYYAFYDNIDGLTKTNPIIYKGLKVGLVSDIRISSDHANKIKVTYSITNSDIVLTEGTVAEIISADLLGSKAVKLRIPDGNPILEDDQEITGELEEGIRDQVNRQLEPLQNKVENLFGSVDSVLTVVTDLLNTTSVNDIKSSLKGLSETITNLSSFSSSLDSLLQGEEESLKSSLQNINGITTTLRNNQDEIENTLQNLSQISDTIAQANIGNTLKNFNASMANASALLDRIVEGEGSIGKLVNTDELHNSLEETVESMNRLMEDIRYHPERYLHFSLVGRKGKGIKLTPSEEKELQQILKESKNDK